MAAPTQVAATNSTANATTGLTLTGLQAGDLLVVVANASADGSPGPSVSGFDSTPTSIGSFTLDKKITDGTKAIYVWSIVLASTPAGGQITTSISNWFGSGTRRLHFSAYRPPSGTIVPAWGANRLVRSTDANVEADGWTYDGSNVGHSTLDAGDSSRTRQAVGIITTHGGSAATLTYDFDANGTADGDGTIFASPGTTLTQGSYKLFDAGAAPVSAGTKVQVLGSQGTNVSIACAVIYVLEKQTHGHGFAAAKSPVAVGHPYKYVEARGRAAAYGLGKPVTSGGTPPILTSGRGRAAAAGFGAGNLFSALRQGRARAASAAVGHGLIRQQARGRGAADAQGYAFRVPRQVEARGRAAAAGFGAGNLFNSRRSGRAYSAAAGVARFQAHADGRGRAAGYARGVGVLFGQYGGHGFTAGAGYGAGNLFDARREGRASTAGSATGVGLLLRLAEARGNAAAAATATYTYVAAPPPPRTVTLTPAAAAVILEGATANVVLAS